MRVSKSAVYSILKKYKETGSVEAYYPERQSRITQEQIEAIEKKYWSTGYYVTGDHREIESADCQITGEQYLDKK